MVSDWLTVEGKKYHFDSVGYMDTGLVWINDNYYYFYPKGHLASSEWIEDLDEKYWVNKDGIWDGSYPERELSVPIVVQHLPQSYWHGNQTVQLLVLHDTGNVKGDSAKGNYSHFINNTEALSRGVAAHAFLDNTVLLQTIPSDIKTLHVKGSYNGKSFNTNSYGLELCNLLSQEDVDTQFDDAAKYFAQLCIEYGLDPYKDIHSHGEMTKLGNVYGGHTDPSLIWQNGGMIWTNFETLWLIICNV